MKWKPLKKLKSLLTGGGATPQVCPAAYWEERRQMRYYREVIRLARKHAPTARTVLDVGPNGTPLVTELSWIGSKTVIDLKGANVAGATCLKGDFLAYMPQQMFDLVLCLQVLEHVRPAAAFARKLLATGRTVIISVPYCWPAGGCSQHVHDPVDCEKLQDWTGQPFRDDTIVRDGRRARLIGVFDGTAVNASAWSERQLAA